MSSDLCTIRISEQNKDLIFNQTGEERSMRDWLQSSLAQGQANRDMLQKIISSLTGKIIVYSSSVSSTGSDEDRTRFFRLSLVIIDELTQILRDLLHEEVHPTQIFKKVIEVNHLIIALRKDQIAVIRDAKTRGYQDFDITLLYTLLRNVCQNITPPSQNWGVVKMPSQYEVTVGDDIERIRLIRNKLFGHISEAAISKTDFQEYWSTTSDFCTRMQTLMNKDYVRRLQYAEECSVDLDAENKCIKLMKRLKEEKGKTLIETSFLILNELVDDVNELTSEAELNQIYQSIVDVMRANLIDSENLQLQNLFKKLHEKVQLAKLPGRNILKILANFHKFHSTMNRICGTNLNVQEESYFSM